AICAAICVVLFAGCYSFAVMWSATSPPLTTVDSYLIPSSIKILWAAIVFVLRRVPGIPYHHLLQ
ncbi:hypothetical protein V1520DRAFT_272626, partial [Lipomyces starkeyi]